MTPAQRLAHALYGSCEPERVQEARDFAKRLKESGFAIVPVDGTYDAICAGDEAIVRILEDQTFALKLDVRTPASVAFPAMIQAYQQEIET